MKQLCYYRNPYLPGQKSPDGDSAEQLLKLLSDSRHQHLVWFWFQIKANKDTIEDIKLHGGGIPAEVTNRLNQLETKVGLGGPNVPNFFSVHVSMSAFCGSSDEGVNMFSMFAGLRAGDQSDRT